MGIIVRSPVSTASGIEICNSYVCIYNRYLQITFDPISKKRKIMASVRFYKDYSYRNTNNFFHFDDIVVEVDENDLANPYTHIYDKLKEMYPDTGDHYDLDD